MTLLTQDNLPADESPAGFSELFYFAGFRYWTISLLPALVGTTLPFWLRPPNFSFRWLGAIEFLVSTALFHAGFSFLLTFFQKKRTIKWPQSRLLGYACVCIVLACLLGLLINKGLRLREYVYGNIFIVFGISAILMGVLYAAPPASYWRRGGGEIVIAESLGMMPVLGAYLVQVGDLTRTVYLASLPLVVATGLWVWIKNLISRPDDEKTGRRTMVIDFGLSYSGRYAVLLLATLFLTTLLIAVFSVSINPLALITLLLSVSLYKIVAVSWREHLNPVRMIRVQRAAFMLHLATCSIITVSSLATQFA
jgi:1,4-dihydroxy-2-naphthoate octaprenyltransferase